VLDHVCIHCGDPATSKRFYGTVLAPLGGKAILSFDPVTTPATTARSCAIPTGRCATNPRD
jgi:catechol 2,3-dioxygenase-like lactoylglutathione lyase family enzyme